MAAPADALILEPRRRKRYLKNRSDRRDGKTMTGTNMQSRLATVVLTSLVVGILVASATAEPLADTPSNVAVDIVKNPLVMKGLLCNSRQASNRTSAAVRPETAVMRSLRWLRETQSADGSWSTDKDPKAVGTALAVLTFLSHGENPTSAEFGVSVEKGLKYILSVQQKDGTFKEIGPHPAIGHGIVTLALCEAHGMTRIPVLLEAADRALAVILVAQRKSGLWDARYRLNDGADDLEVSAWQIKAVFAGLWMGSKTEGLTEALEAAADAITTTAAGDPATAPFAIQPLLLLHRNRSPAYASALATIKETNINWAMPGSADPVVRWHFTEQALFRHGGDLWCEWNRLSAPNLFSSQTVAQTAKGAEVGYWDSPGKSEKYGRIYSTALCSFMSGVYSLRPVYEPEPPNRDSEHEEVNIEIK